MSTGDSQLHAVSTMISTDIYKKYVKKDADEYNMYRIAKFGVLVFGLISVIFALLKPALLSDILTLANAGVGALAPSLIGALYWKRATKEGALASIVIGEIVMVLFTFILKISPLGFGPGLWAMGISLIVFIIVSLCTKPQKHTVDVINDITAFFAK